jgi:hypothetical protein
MYNYTNAQNLKTYPNQYKSTIHFGDDEIKRSSEPINLKIILARNERESQ